MSSVTISSTIEAETEEILAAIKAQLPSRAYRGANELRNSALDILSGQGSGRTYRVPGTSRTYTASAPGEVPAKRTGKFRISWKPRSFGGGTTYTSRIENNQSTGKYILGDILENGTPGGQMAPRPHHEKIQKHALPKLKRIYDEPYV